MKAIELKSWLEEHDAVLIALVEHGAFKIIVRSPTHPVTGIGVSPEFEEAIRIACHYFEAGIVQLARSRAREIEEA